MRRSSPNRSTYLSLPLSPAVPKAAAVQVFLRPPDTLTGNGLRCFPAPVNKLPACEGIDGFDIRCCLTQKRRGSPWDGPIPHAAHPSCEAIKWMGYKASPRGGGPERGEEGVRLHPRMWVEVTMGLPTTFPHLGCSIFTGPFCQAPSRSDC